MTPDEVERVVLAAIGDDWERWSTAEHDLRACLVRPPRVESYIVHTVDQQTPVNCWLVLEEAPDTHDGYEVFYDPEDETFGLGSHFKDDERHYLGNYASFWDTLEGM